MPKGELNPVTVVTEVGLRETMDTEPPFGLAVQIREPSKAIPKGPLPKELVKVLTIPAGWVGSIMYRLPDGFVCPATKTLPIAQTIPTALVAPVQVSSTFPSLDLTLITL